MVATNLGTDHLICYNLQVDSHSDPLKIGQIIDSPGGSGPRHSVFHPHLNYLYTTLELSSQIIVHSCKLDGIWYTVQIIDSYRKLAEHDNKSNLCADIHISPDGKFLYCSNRGYNYISVFEISQSDGILIHVQDIGSHGLIPRSFCLDKFGDFLLAANQDSNNISVFQIDKDIGRLTYVSSYQVPTPVCIISA